jgi:hypothetical protein
VPILGPKARVCVNVPSSLYRRRITPAIHSPCLSTGASLWSNRMAIAVSIIRPADSFSTNLLGTIWNVSLTGLYLMFVYAISIIAAPFSDPLEGN